MIKKGLGSAYIEGFNYVISKKYSYIFQLDADGSHSPLDLEILQNHISKNKIELTIFAVNYNVLRIMSGMGGLVYSN